MYNGMLICAIATWVYILHCFCLGIRSKDSFVVVHPSESVGIICNTCKRTFATKKSLKRHCKEAHKTNPEAKSTAKSKQKIGQAEGKLAGSSLLTGSSSLGGKGSVAKNVVSNTSVKSYVSIEQGGKVKDKSKLSKDKKASNSKKSSLKCNASASKTEGKSKMAKNNIKKVLPEKKVGIMVSKGDKENKKAKRNERVEKKAVNKSKKVLTGKKIVSSKSKSNLTIPKKTSKTEKDVKLVGKNFAGMKHAKMKKGDEKFKKVSLENRRQDETIESGKKGKAMKNFDGKNASHIDVRTKKKAKDVSKVQLKEAKVVLSKNDVEDVMPFKCDECGERFKNMFNLKKHLPVHSIIKYHCYRCDDVFMNMRSLTKHLLIHEDEAPVSDHLHRCRICSQGFKTSRMLRGHMLEHERVEELESLLVANKTKSKPVESKNAALKLEGKMLQRCSFENDTKSFDMGDKSSNKSLLGRSKRKSRSVDATDTKQMIGPPGEEKREKAEIDDYFSSKHCSLTKPNFLCPLCQLGFENYTEYKGHVIESHINFGDMSLQCEMCSEVFTSENEVESHLVSFHNLTCREARVMVRQKEREAVYCGSRSKGQTLSQKVNCEDPGNRGNDFGDRSDNEMHTAHADVPKPNGELPSLGIEDIEMRKEREGFAKEKEIFDREEDVEFETMKPDDSFDSKSDDTNAIQGCAKRIHENSSSLCVDESCASENKQIRDVNEKHYVKDESSVLREHSIPGENHTEADVVQMKADEDSKSFVDEKSCFLQEQESRDILQALFIEIDDENPDEEKCQNFQIGENQSKVRGESDREIDDVYDGGEKVISGVKRQPYTRETRFLSGNKYRFGKNRNKRTSVSRVMMYQEFGDINPRFGAENSIEVGRVAEELVDLSNVDDEDDGDIDWFWKNDENENAFEMSQRKGKASDGSSVCKNQRRSKSEIRMNSNVIDSKPGVMGVRTKGRRRRGKGWERNAYNEKGREPVHNNSSDVIVDNQTVGKIKTDSSVIDQTAFVPFVRRQASICGERRILESINAGKGRKKNVGLIKKSAVSGNEQPYENFLSSDNENSTLVGRGSHCKASHEKNRAENARGRGTVSASPGRKRKWAVLSSENVHSNEKQCNTAKRVMLEQGEKSKASGSPKRRKRRWMFGKMNKNAKRTLSNKSRKTFHGQDKFAEESQDVSPPSSSNVECGLSDQNTECLTNTGFIDEGQCHTLEGVDTGYSDEGIDNITSFAKTDIDTSLHVENSNQSDVKSSMKRHRNGGTNKLQNRTKIVKADYEAAREEASPLAALIYVRRQAAVASEGKIQKASKSRRISSGVDEDIGKDGKTETDGPLLLTSAENLQKEVKWSSQKSKRKSRFKKLQQSESGSSSYLNGVIGTEEMIEVNNKLCECCSSIHCTNSVSPASRKIKNAWKVTEKETGNRDATLLRSSSNCDSTNVPANDGPMTETANIAVNKTKEAVNGRDDRNKLKCDICGKMFNTMYFLRLHEKRHSSDTPPKPQTSNHRKAVVFRCKICTMALASKEALARHLKAHHDRGKQKGAGTSKLKTKRHGVKGHRVIVNNRFKDN